MLKNAFFWHHIICKFLEVVKSNTIILMHDCNNHLHTLSKKNKVLNFIIFGENKGGGAGHQVPKKSKILGQQKFLADGVAGGSKNRPSDNFGHIVPPSWRNCNFNQKQKSYSNWKLCNAEKSKIMVAPPPLVLNVQTRRVCPEIVKLRLKNFIFNILG